VLAVQGQSLGCGAHLVALRRTRIGDFNVSSAWKLTELVEAVNLSRGL
jgi:tRNA U55 pseudouridine synthase TruB